MLLETVRKAPALVPASSRSLRVTGGGSALCALGLLIALACSNEVKGPEGAAGTAGAAGSSSGKGGSGPLPPVDIPPVVNVVTRLNRVEYSYTVRDLLGE